MTGSERRERENENGREAIEKISKNDLATNETFEFVSKLAHKKDAL